VATVEVTRATVDGIAMSPILAWTAEVRNISDQMGARSDRHYERSL